MRTWEGNLRQIRLSPSGRGAWIDCPAAAVPSPGRYVQCWSPEDPEKPLSTTVFPGGYVTGGFIAAAPVPAGWEPGCKLVLSGPLGKGFSLPAGCKHLVLVALGNTADRLLPLLKEALEQKISVAMCTHPFLPALPSEIEIFPKSTLPEILPWADFLAMDIHVSQTVEVIQLLNDCSGSRHSLKGQVLVHSPMPCGGVADCGVCAVSTSRGVRLACKDGPVFDLSLFG